MELSKKKFLMVLTLCFLIAFTSGYAIQNNLYRKLHQTPKQTVNLLLVIESPFGTYDLFSGNIITNLGENATGQRIGINGTYVQVRWISLGNATASATLTKLTTEATTLGAERQLGTYVNFTYSNDFAFNVTVKFYFSGDISLNCSGLHWSSVSNSDNNMYACADFGPQQFHNLWNMTARWTIISDCN